jgi:hypothetical protein
MVHGEKKDDGHADTSKLAVLGCFFVSPPFLVNSSS